MNFYKNPYVEIPSFRKAEIVKRLDILLGMTANKKRTEFLLFPDVVIKKFLEDLIKLNSCSQYLNLKNCENMFFINCGKI